MAYILDQATYRRIQSILSVSALLFLFYQASDHLDSKVGGAIALMVTREVIYIVRRANERKQWQEQEQDQVDAETKSQEVDMSSKSQAVFGWVKLFLPLVLGSIPATAPIAEEAAQVIANVEALGNKDGKTGSQKKALYVDSVRAVAQAAKDKGAPINVDEATATASSAVETAFHAARVHEVTLGPPTPGAPVPVPE